MVVLSVVVPVRASVVGTSSLLLLPFSALPLLSSEAVVIASVGAPLLFVLPALTSVRPPVMPVVVPSPPPESS